MDLAAQDYRHQNEILLWPDGAPGSNPENWPWEGYNHQWRIDSASGKELSIFVTEPTLQVFLPPEDINTGAAVIICPGGGYNVVVIGKEGYDIAMEFNSRGIAAIVLNYRHYNQFAALQDAQRSIHYARLMAAEWGINENISCSTIS